MSRLEERSPVTRDLRTTPPSEPRGIEQAETVAERIGIIRERLEASSLSAAAVKKALALLLQVAASGLATKVIAKQADVPGNAVSNYRYGNWRSVPKASRDCIEAALAQLGVRGYQTAAERKAQKREKIKRQYLEFHRLGRRCPPATN